MDFVLDYFVLHLDSEPSYRKFMDNMLCKNEQYEFAPVSSYEEFKKVLFQSLGGEEKFRRDYETIITFLLYASNKFFVPKQQYFGQFSKEQHICMASCISGSNI